MELSQSNPVSPNWQALEVIPEGAILKDTYIVERYLGSGVSGEVYRVRHKFLGRQALKVLYEQDMDEEQTMELLHEPRLLSALGHPNIVKVFEANVLGEEYGRRAYFTMEYGSGGTLHEHLESKQLLPLAEAMDITRQICAGVAFAHQQQPRPIVHRDLRPQNILLIYTGQGRRVIVSDFGLAKPVNELTFFTSSAGHILCRPPEALEYNVHPPAGDVFAVGLMLYRMLTGSAPFDESIQALDAKGLQTVLIEARKRAPRPPSEIVPTLDGLIDELALKALKFEASLRYESAGEMLKDILNKADKYAEKAVECSRWVSRLDEARSYMVKAIALNPSLGSRYAYLMALWERGIAI